MVNGVFEDLSGGAAGGGVGGDGHVEVVGVV